MEAAVLTCAQLGLDPLRALFSRYGITLEQVPDGEPIPGSFFGEREAGLIGRCLWVRGDTPVHSALHEGCHLICMDEERRRVLHTDAGGEYEEENGVLYLQILLTDLLPGFSRADMQNDMDRWGYTFRLGSARAWFEQDADDARAWLLQHGLITAAETPTWRLRA